MSALSAEAISLLKVGNKIGAIVSVREAQKLGLKEAKELVEQHISENPGAYPELHKGALKGSALLLALVALVGFLVFYFSNH